MTGFGSKPSKITALVAGLLLSGAVAVQAAPTAPSITTEQSTTFLAGATAALHNTSTNIIYLEQSGVTPTVVINQDGHGNRAGADSAGNTASMLIDGASQVVTIDQTGNFNVINSLTVKGDGAQVYIQQLGDSNTINASCGTTTRCEGSNNANLDWRLDSRTGGGAGNTLNYNGNGNNLTSAIYVTGSGNTINSTQSSTGSAGQQQLINIASSNNNTVTVVQDSASMSSLVLSQNGFGGTTFNILQTGTFSNVANIQATSNGGSFNIIQRSH